MDLLPLYSSIWQRYNAAVRRVDALFRYFNGVVQKMNDALPEKVPIALSNGRLLEIQLKTIAELGCEIWKWAVHYFLRDERENIVLMRVLSAVNNWRTGECELSKDEIDVLSITVGSYYACDALQSSSFDSDASESDEEVDSGLRFSVLELETPFRELTKEHYRIESLKHIRLGDTSSYIKYVSIPEHY